MAAATDQPLDIYTRSLEAEVKAEVCTRHAAGFAAKFERAYQAWRAANAAALAEGAAAAAAGGMMGPSGTGIAAFARMNAEVLESLPQDDRQRRCDALLAFFAAGRVR